MAYKNFFAGTRAAVPTQIGYLSIGLAFGVVASEAGLTALETLLSSVFVYSGSGQFALVALLVDGADLPSIALTVFLINLRHFLMNLHTSTIFQGVGLGHQVALGSFVTDESYGVLLSHYLNTKSFSPAWMYGNNFSSYLSWMIATVLGNLVGYLLPNPSALGVDFALVAMFVAIFIGQLEGLIRQVPIKRIVYVLVTVLVVYLTASIVMTSSLAVLLATILACTVGVMTDD